MSQPDWIGQWRQLHEELAAADWPAGIRVLLHRRDSLIAQLGKLEPTQELAAALEEGRQAADSLRLRWRQSRNADRDSLAAMITEQQRLSAIANYA